MPYDFDFHFGRRVFQDKTMDKSYELHFNLFKRAFCASGYVYAVQPSFVQLFLLFVSMLLITLDFVSDCRQISSLLDF